MTIASEITKLNTNLTNSYTACQNKGATMPANQNFDNLATCISSISGGTTPTLTTKNITQNGTYNASSDNADGYSSVTVNVSGGGDVLNKTNVNYAITTDNYSVINVRYGSNGINSLDVSTMGGSSFYFAGAYNNSTYRNTVRAVILRNLRECNGFQETFYQNNKLQYIDLSELISLYCDGSNRALYRAFYGTSIEEIRFTKLANIIDYSATPYRNNQFAQAFQGCSDVNIYFNALNSNSFGGYYYKTFTALLQYATDCTVHLPSNLQNNYNLGKNASDSGQSWIDDYTAGFKGTNTTVLFDLPATS